MSLSGTVQATIFAVKTSTYGLSRETTRHPLDFYAAITGCSKSWSDRRTIAVGGVDDLSLTATGLAAVRLIAVKNLSQTDSMALSAGWNGVEFRNFLVDSQSWNFSPMVNLGSATFRGYPIGPGSLFMNSNTSAGGWSTTVGGSTLRIGGPAGLQYEIYLVGT